MLGFVKVLLLAGKPTNEDYKVILAVFDSLLKATKEYELTHPRFRGPNEPHRETIFIDPNYHSTERRDWFNVIHDIEQNRYSNGEISKEPSEQPYRAQWEQMGRTLAEMKRVAVRKWSFDPPEIRPLTSFYWPAKFELRNPDWPATSSRFSPPSYSPDGSMSVIRMHFFAYHPSTHWHVLKRTSAGWKQVAQSNLFFL